jgi:hypothetical protein
MSIQSPSSITKAEAAPNGVARPKVHRNTCLEARPYLQDNKRTQSLRHKSKAGRYDNTKAQVVSLHLSAQMNKFVKGETGPTFGEEGVHEILSQVLGKHRELRHIQLRIAGLPIVILRQTPDLTLADCLLRRRAVRGNQ